MFVVVKMSLIIKLDKRINILSSEKDVDVLMIHVVDYCKHKVCGRLGKVADAFKRLVHQIACEFVYARNRFLFDLNIEK